MKKDFISVLDITKEDIDHIFDISKSVKKNRFEYKEALSGKTIMMIFDKPSTRTKVSFFVGISELGGIPLALNSSELQVGRGETIRDTAIVLSRYVHGIVIRTFSHQNVLELGRYSSIPVINALTDYEHPCQALADIFTIYEKFSSFDLKITFLGDFNNVARSLMLISSIVGVREFCVSGPKKYISTEDTEKASILSNGKTKVTLEPDPKIAVKNADVVYTDVWVSMGFEKETEEREILMKPYQVNKEIFSLAKDSAIFMHCLPARRGKEVTDEVIDSSRSVVWDQAENRLHTQKALMIKLFQR